MFRDERDYKAYLKSKDLGDIKLHDINQVFKDFEEKGKLPPEWPEQPSKKK